MSNQPIIGCVQLNSQSDIESNLSIIERAIKHAKLAGVHLLVLPENACRMGNQFELSERFEDLSNWYAKLAFKHQLFIVAGTLPCPFRPNGDRVANGKLRQVSQLFAPDGQRFARYDKIHLFRAEVGDDTGSYNEAKTFEPGDTTIVASCDMANLDNGLASNKSGLFNIGMMVCFDLRFPALAQRLRQAGADILTAPSAFTYQTGKAHWNILLRARALDAQCLLVGAAQGGTHIYKRGQNRETWGHSAIANANGEIINQIASSSLPVAVVDNNTHPQPNQDYASIGYTLITSLFDEQMQQDWRQNMPINHCHRLS